MKVQALLPGRSTTAITVRANRAGLAPERHPWTPREQQFLKKHYGSMPVEDIAKALGRTVRAVRGAVVIYKPDKVQITPRWTEQELAIIRTHYRSDLTYVLSQLPDRTRDAIRVQAIKMNIRLKTRWSEEEEQIVREFYPVMGKKVADKLPGRTALAIMYCAMRLGLTK
ncbi:MAG: SANT/Myb-like DNA-binding domain-containing protein [Enterobacter ludwigii]|nr:SANT/Myb-like DNA-binding domain-containing protein [Enterobacter ludwigii]